ncbi:MULTISPECIES: LysM peptidoglycan-binding domain-containing protein [unclassified Arthrobacter]|uniref:C40 family peptidase n=1 Tax=unclassified Arthrobacter TaxID=235627 RepID=UPI003396F54F
MSKKYTAARHRAATTTASRALAIGRPALVVAAASGLFFGFSAPAQASVHEPDSSGTANVQSQTSAPAAAVAPAPAPAPANAHTVVSGDTLGQISATYGVDLNNVLAANGLSLTSVIYPGDQIQIPAAGQAAPAVAQAVALAPAAKTAAAPAAPANTGIKPAATSAPVQAPSGSAGSAILASAYSQLGVHQDCTAMVEKALRSVGKSVGDLAPGQFFQYGSVVGTPAPGDLVITAGHVGVFAGNGQVVSGGVDGFKTEVHSISWLHGASFVRVA